jgi:PLD-like domain
MEEQDQAWIQPIPSPWRDVLLQAISQVQRELFFICPFLKEQVITDLKTTLQTRVSSTPLRVRVLTRVLPDDLLVGASDLSALQQLLRWPQELPGSSVELRAIDKVHAKVWLIDNAQAIIGSGNATPSGLDRNLEYGVAITNAKIVARVWQDWELWWNRAGMVNEQLLEQMQNWLIDSRQQLQKLETARREILRTIGPAPRIGQHLFPRARQPETAPTVSGHTTPATPPDTSSPTPAAALPIEPGPNRLAEARQAYIAPETLTVSPTYLLAALRWVYPFPLDEAASQVAPSTQEFIRLTWNRDIQQITLTSANGQRRSEASIPARGEDTGTPWAITLNLQDVRTLTHALRRFNRGANLGGSAKEITQLELYSSGSSWSLNVQDDATWSFSFAATQTNPPPAFPHLQAPISRLTGIEQQDLQNMLTQQTVTTTTWLRLASFGPTFSLTFSANVPDHPTHVISLSADQSQLIGPSLTLQLATSALLQALLGGVSVAVSRWSIEIDRDAKAMQFVPETEDEIVRVWRHHLWHVGE